MPCSIGRVICACFCGTLIINNRYLVEGGEFVYAQIDKINPSQQITIVEKLQQMGLPMDDDWLYDTFSVQKPKNYAEQKADAEAKKEALRQALEQNQGSGEEKNTQGEQSSNKDKKAFKDRLRGFFGLAPNSWGTDF